MRLAFGQTEFSNLIFIFTRGQAPEIFYVKIIASIYHQYLVAMGFGNFRIYHEFLRYCWDTNLLQSKSKGIALSQEYRSKSNRLISLDFLVKKRTAGLFFTLTRA